MACDDSMEEWIAHIRCNRLCEHGCSISQKIWTIESCRRLPQKTKPVKSKDTILALLCLIVLMGSCIIGAGLLVK